MHRDRIEITIRKYVNNNEYAVRSVIDTEVLLHSTENNIKDILYASFEKMIKQMEHDLGSLRE